jgi:hypothetical protein
MSSVLNHEYGRAGVIPYAIIDGSLFICLAKDNERNCYSDFGGKIENNEDIYDTASRELKEESCGVFMLSAEKIQKNHTGVCFNNYGITFFVPWEDYILDTVQSVKKEIEFQLNRNKINEEYKECQKNGNIFTARKLITMLEVEYIKWISVNDFVSILTSKYGSGVRVIRGLEKTIFRNLNNHVDTNNLSKMINPLPITNKCQLHS